MDKLVKSITIKDSKEQLTLTYVSCVYCSGFHENISDVEYCKLWHMMSAKPTKKPYENLKGIK